MNADAQAVRRLLADTLGRQVRGVISAYLFGSVAEGRAHRESDVDVGILLDRAVYPRAADRFDVRLRSVGLLSAAVGRDTDVVILNDAPPQLARHILAAGDRLLLNDAAVDHAFRRTTLSRAADLEPFLRRARQVKLQSLDR
jgi:predicted nucleotidyltransferase